MFNWNTEENTIGDGVRGIEINYVLTKQDGTSKTYISLRLVISGWSVSIDNLWMLNITVTGGGVRNNERARIRCKGSGKRREEEGGKHSSDIGDTESY